MRLCSTHVRWQSLLLGLVLGALSATTGQAQQLPLEAAEQAERTAERIEAYRARADTLIDFYAGRVDPSDYSNGGYSDIAAALYRSQHRDWVRARLDTLMQNPRGDMFWMYPMTLIHFVGKDVLPETYRQRLRALWRTYRPYRGDTENHWVMYYSSLYLMTQLYPGAPGAQWFNGKSSAVNHAEARDYLLHWMELTTTRGQGEFDSPHYMSYYVLSMAMLYGYAEDPAMRTRAQMMLDYLLADFAVESLGGLYVGAFSRIYPEPLLERWRDNSTSYAWLLFGNAPFRPHLGAMILAMSGYEPPAMLGGMATDRSAPYVHRELKRTRHRIRYSDQRNTPVYKYTYMRQEYALGSIQGGLLQPIQQHTWELHWAAPGRRQGHNLLFTLHPYASGHELGMYFPEEPRTMIEAVLKSKGTYDSPKKWTGASPYEQVVQVKDALVVLYAIPEGTRFPHVNGYFSRALSRREEDEESGWIFARGGEALIAYYPLAPYTWQRAPGGDWRLFSPHRRNGAVVQVAPAGAYETFEAFKAAVRALPLKTTTAPQPRVQFTTLRGDQMTVRYGAEPRINGKGIAYEEWPLFEGPFLQASPGSGQLKMQYGRQHRLLDFNTVTLKEWVAEQPPSQ